MAIEFLDLLSADHHAIDDEFYRQLGEVFTAAQIIELGFTCAETMGVHRFIHTLDVFGTGEPGDRATARPGRHRDAVRRSATDRRGSGVGVSETVLVTGATGLTGANVCKQLIERGDHVQALARQERDADPLADLGVEVVAGDITDADDVLRAAKGCDAAIHCAALLGGASQDLADFQAVNTDGTAHVLDAAEALDMRRVVAVSTGTFFDTSRRPRSRGRAGEPRNPARTRTRSPRWRPSRTPWPAPRPVTTSSPPTPAPSTARPRWPATRWAAPASTGCCSRRCGAGSSGTCASR